MKRDFAFYFMMSCLALCVLLLAAPFYLEPHLVRILIDWVCITFGIAAAIVLAFIFYCARQATKGDQTDVS